MVLPLSVPIEGPGPALPCRCRNHINCPTGRTPPKSVTPARHSHLHLQRASPVQCPNPTYPDRIAARSPAPSPLASQPNVVHDTSIFAHLWLEQNAHFEPESIMRWLLRAGYCRASFCMLSHIYAGQPSHPPTLPPLESPQKQRKRKCPFQASDSYSTFDVPLHGLGPLPFAYSSASSSTSTRILLLLTVSYRR